MINRLEPGLLRIFRYFNGIAMVYFACLVAYTALDTHRLFSASQSQLYLNLATNLALFGYLSWSWLRRIMRGSYLPVALISATAVPLLSNLVFLYKPTVSDLPDIVLRSWLLLPILVVPVVIMAWQYPLRYVVIFAIATGGIELALLVRVAGRVDIDTLPVLGVPIIQAFAFGTVGHIVSHLVTSQRTQRQALLDANVKLGQYARTAEQLATSRERNRLARELHDTLAHTLSAQTVNLEAIKLMIPAEQDEIHAMLQHSLDNTRKGLAETRRALKDLRSKQLEDLGLSLALRHLAQDVSQRGTLRLEIDLPDRLPDLPAQTEQSLYRIAQEALENVVRHANARSVWLRLTQEDSRLCLSIADDGEGFDLDDPNVGERLGMRGMSERAALAAGTIQVQSRPGGGTTVLFSIEVPDGARGDL
jgi:signal transduction histidine kinase